MIEFKNNSSNTKLLLGILLLSYLLSYFLLPIQAHSIGPINSSYNNTSDIPTLSDGKVIGNEWSHANYITFGTNEEYNLTHVYFKNDLQFLYVLIDMPFYGSTYFAGYVILCFDTGNDASWTENREDKLRLDHLGTNNNLLYHYKCNRTGVAGEYKEYDAGSHVIFRFGNSTSPLNASYHKVCELTLSLSVLGLRLGKKIGFSIQTSYQKLLSGPYNISEYPNNLNITDMNTWADLQIAVQPLDEILAELFSFLWYIFAFVIGLGLGALIIFLVMKAKKLNRES